MADSPVQGKNVAILMREGLEDIPMLCGTDCTYTRGKELVEKSGPTSGDSRQWIERLKQHTSTVTGLTNINNNGSLSWFYLLGKTGEQTITMTFEDDLGNLFLLTGPALLGTMGINGPMTDFSTATIEIFWNGAPETSIIPPPTLPEEFAIWIDESNGLVVGATSVSHADLTQAGVEILGAERTGTGLLQVGGSITSGSLEFTFNAGTGTIATDPDNPYNAGEFIYVLYKIT